jgi:NADH:ubiquinone oxidoreductase subunit F (NADH-binding)
VLADVLDSRADSRVVPAPGAQQDGPVALPRLLEDLGRGGGPVPLGRHRERYPAPPPPGRRREDLISPVEAAGLRGRGGAEFPTGAKLRAVGRGWRRPVVVVNGTESEPVSLKDPLLLARHPHLVLDGALLAAAAVGAPDVVVAVKSGLVPAVQAAMTERLDETDVRLRLVVPPERFVAGEETALVHLLNGGPAAPTFKRRRPSEVGVEGRPTLVDNAETMAHMAQIQRFGPAWFRRLGTEEQPGTLLLTVTGGVAQPGVYEAAFGEGLAEVLGRAGVLPGMAAVLVGGYFGSWVHPSAVAQARLTRASLRGVGAAIGCGAIVVLPDGACGLAESARVLAWMAGQSAGQCGPCVNGLPAIARAASELCRTGDGAVVHLLDRWAGQVEGRGACRLPDGSVRFVRSALRVFADHLSVHQAGRCRGDTGFLPIPNQRAGAGPEQSGLARQSGALRAGEGRLGRHGDSTGRPGAWR